MDEPIYLRWLGVAGIELVAGDQVLVVDPCFTRPPFRRLWFGRVEPDRELIAAKLPRCDFILVSHPHYDHLLDAPAIALRTGASLAGSANACRLAAAWQVPAGQLRPIRVGDRLALGPFEVEVLPAVHDRTPLDRVLNAALPPRLRPPLRLLDYRMDACFSFLIRVGRHRILYGEAPVRADLWLTMPARSHSHNTMLSCIVQPQIVMPIHWDDFFRPLSRPIRPMLALPQRAWPPIRWQSPGAFGRAVIRGIAGARVMVPEVFRPYVLAELLPARDANSAGPGSSADGVLRLG